MSYYYEFAEDETDNYEEMERQIQEEKFFDECWEIHSAMMECIEDECIPILQNCKFDNFYKLCQQGEQYIVNLEKQDNIAKQKRLHFLQNLNKPIKYKPTKWITLGQKKNLTQNYYLNQKMNQNQSILCLNLIGHKKNNFFHLITHTY